MSAPSDGSACLLCRGPQVRRYRLGMRWLAYCRACQLGQLTPLPDEEELATLYASSQYFSGTDRVGYADYASDAPQFARTFRTKVQTLLRYGPVHDLMEIGCGPGYFLHQALAAGVPRAVGVDRNRWAVNEARQSGLEVYLGSLEAVPRERTFDAAVMLDLLEHITQPVAFLADVRARLRPEGRILITTPNIRSLLARGSGRRWVSIKVPEHVYYYSPRSIRRLLESAGFAVLSVRGAGQYVTVAFLLSRLHRLAPRLTGVLRVGAHTLGLAQRVLFVTNGSIDVVARARPATSAGGFARTALPGASGAGDDRIPR